MPRPSTSTSQNEDMHASGSNINSYVSLYNQQSFICGGARLGVDQVLTIGICFEQIRDHYRNISARTAPYPGEHYTVHGYKTVSKTLFIIIVSSLAWNFYLKRKFGLPFFIYTKKTFIKSIKCIDLTEWTSKKLIFSDYETQVFLYQEI